MKSGGATADQVAALNAHEYLQSVLKKFNGGLHFMDTFKGLSVD